jgi:hypothetical protein
MELFALKPAPRNSDARIRREKTSLCHAPARKIKSAGRKFFPAKDWQIHLSKLKRQNPPP